ncbi:TVP38/TMEM64 family protein [Pseudooceanicola sp. MF1-13]|uniref:TVP38/TMEM64 family protein n=1 Tax=Pseudooceanicola sp. MF1-13 TaxID=3379095 RepID=UPI003891B9DA
MSDSSPSALRRFGPLILLIVLAVLAYWQFGDRLSFQTLQTGHEALEAYRDRHYALTLILFVLVYAAIVALSLPGATVATLTGGFLFGMWPGTLLNVLGATIGAICIFLAVRAGFGRVLTAKIDAQQGRIARIKQGLDRNQWPMLFFIRLVPVIPFFAANLLPALLNVPLSRFAISTALGIVPGALVYTSVGAGLGRVLEEGGRPDLGIIFEPFILLPLLGLAALSLIPIFFRGKAPV